MEMHWLDRWRAKVLDILRHPWHSLVSALAAVGDLVLWIVQVLAKAAVWLWQRLRRLAYITLPGLLKSLAFGFAGLCLLGFLFALLLGYPTTKVPNFRPVDQQVYISQGWGWTGGQDAALRQLFYYTPQGAGLKDVRYSWFVNLEVPWGKTRFADPRRMSAYGFVVDDAPTPLNPYRLPVGFTSHYDPKFGEKVLDLTCAACHTGELDITKNGKRYGLRIDGGPAMHSFTAMHIGDFAPELLGSLTATYFNPLKFVRFAKRVLGRRYPQGRWRLHHDLGTVIGELFRQAVNDKSRHLYPVEEGPGRIDALGRIGNTVFGDELSSVNYKISNAPVRYPPLWDIWKFNYVQYNASVRQPMTRNVSESLGTGARAELLDRYGAPIPPDQRFDTSVRMDNLSELETALWSLEPPKWNEDCMGKIDWDRAKKGRVIFENTCQHCHGPFPASDPIKEWFAYLKSPGYTESVLKNWQKFMNQVYEVPEGSASEGQSAPPPPPPSAQNQIGITLAVNEEETANPQAAPPAPLFTPLLPSGRNEEQEEERAGLRKPQNAPMMGKAPQVRGDTDLPLWIMHPLTVEDIGTDPTAAVNFLEKQIDLSRLGLRPAVANEGMRILLEQDLNGKTDAYGKEILRLCGQKDSLPTIRQMNDSQRQDLRKRALEIAGRVIKAQQELNGKTDAEEILRSCSENQALPAAPQMNEAQLEALRDETLGPEDGVTSSPEALKAARNEADASDLENAVAQFEDAVNLGPSRINNFLASLQLSKLNTGVALRLIVFRARRRFYAERRYSEGERDQLNGFGELDVPEPLAQYKPRPLAGIWAAGPFLHNGSVPTIYQLLLPADRRDKKFFVGTRDFDPVNLGLSTQPSAKGGFWLDTSIPGNSNVGHEFRKGYIPWKEGSPPQYGVIGPEFTEEQRRDIIEYLKIHRDEHKVDPAKDLDGYLREGLDTSNVCQ